MKLRLLILLTLLCFVPPCESRAQCTEDSPQVARLSPAFLGGGVPAAGFSCTPYELACQDFEGSGYDNSESWTENVDARVDADYTTSPAPLRGSQSLGIITGSATTYKTITGTSTISVFFRYQTADSQGVSYNIFTLRDSAGNTLCSIMQHTSGALYIYNGTKAETGVTTLPDGDSGEWCVWANFARGAGTANGTATLYYGLASSVCNGTTCTRPAVNATITAGTWDNPGTPDADAERVYFEGLGSIVNVYDQFLASTTEIVNVYE